MRKLEITDQREKINNAEDEYGITWSTEENFGAQKVKTTLGTLCYTISLKNHRTLCWFTTTNHTKGWGDNIKEEIVKKSFTLEGRKLLNLMAMAAITTMIVRSLDGVCWNNAFLLMNLHTF